MQLRKVMSREAGMDTQYQMHTFANGIRFIHKYLPFSQVSHIGYVLDIGSRDEAPHQQGLAHFWEHMAFKGTRRRRAYHILNRLEAVGGELNAYTTKEKICFYASVLNDYYLQAVDLLTDITFDSVFPEKQIEREKGVILEEIAMYKDSPEEAIQDEFDALVFGDHPLGYNILGTEESVRSFSRHDFREFIDTHLSTDRIVIASVSGLPFEKVLPKVERLIEGIAPRYQPKRRLPFSGQLYCPRQEEKHLPISQAHCALGRPAYSMHHPDRLSFFLLNNLLGGPAMSSRLNMLLRERYGYVYGIESSYTPLSDTGLWGIFFAIDAKHLSKAEKLILQEMQRLCEQPLGVRQLKQAKNQLKGQLAMAEENNLNFMLMMGKTILDYGYIDPLPKLFEEIDAITAGQLQAVAQQIFQPQSLSFLRYIPQQA
uniref:M16 family metallopeptidase n=1 Tax=Thermonema rossianum TaxID=55505 RepID=UPI001FDEBD74|nr:pitrilysin family protein [Thermonema rossianum]